MGNDFLVPERLQAYACWTMLSGAVPKAGQTLDDWLAPVLMFFDLVLHHDLPTLVRSCILPAGGNGTEGGSLGAWVAGELVPH